MTGFSSLLAAVPTGLWIDGTTRESCSGRRFDIVNPATGTVLTTVANGSVADARHALASAAEVQPAWAATAPRERSEILRRAWELVMERSEEFARLITLEMGKPLAESRGEVVYGAEFLRWFAEEAVRIGGRTATAPSGNGHIAVIKEPAVQPWPSRPGTFRSRWGHARSARRSRLDAPSSSNRPRTLPSPCCCSHTSLLKPVFLVVFCLYYRLSMPQTSSAL